MHLKKPYFVYSNDIVHFYPGTPAENVTDTDGAERHDHVATDGTKMSYYVGPRVFQEVTFRWLSDAKKVEFKTFWAGVRNGSTFRFVTDDTVRRLGTGVLGDGYILGDDSDGDAISSTEYTMDTTDMVFSQDEVYGRWTTTIRMQEVV